MIRLVAKLGALAVVGLFSIGWLAVSIGELGGPGGLFRYTYTVTASFRDATGVVKGDEVRLAGVPIGKVGAIEVEKGVALVRLSIDERYRVPDGSRFELHWRSLLGQRYVEIVPPDGATPEGTSLEDGARVGTDLTGDAADLSAFLNSTEPLLSRLDTGALNRVMSTLAVALQGREAEIGAAIDDSAAVLASLQTRAGAIGDTMTNLATLLDGIAAQDDDVRRLLDGLAVTAEAMAGDSATLGDAVGQTGEFAALLDELLAQNAGQLDTALTQFGDLAATLAAREADIEEGVRTMPWTSAALIRATNHGNWIQIYGRGFGIINTWTPEARVGPDYSDVGPDDTASPEPLLGQPTVPLPPLPPIDLGLLQINPPPPGSEPAPTGLELLLGGIAGPPPPGHP